MNMQEWIAHFEKVHNRKPSPAELQQAINNNEIQQTVPTPPIPPVTPPVATSTSSSYWKVFAAIGLVLAMVGAYLIGSNHSQPKTNQTAAVKDTKSTKASAQTTESGKNTETTSTSTTTSTKTTEIPTPSELATGGALDINAMAAGDLTTAKGTWRNGNNTITINGKNVSITSSGKTTNYTMTTHDRPGDGMIFNLGAQLSPTGNGASHTLMFVPGQGNFFDHDGLYLDYSSSEFDINPSQAYTRDGEVITAVSASHQKEANIADVEAFWNSYLDEINNSITAGYDTTAYLWSGEQPSHIKAMMADYISAGVLQSKGGRSFTILSQDNNTVTVSLNGTRTIVLQKIGDSFKIQSFNW